MITLSKAGRLATSSSSFNGKRFIQTRTEWLTQNSNKCAVVYAEHKFKTCTIRQIGAFSDNYIYFIRDHRTGKVGVVDAGEAEPAINAINLWQQTSFVGEHGIDFILNTHHHDDHIGANMELKELYPHCKIIGYDRAQSRLPGCETVYSDGETFSILDCEHLPYELFECAGHTRDHCSFIDYENNLIFCGDTLFSLGCGRLFEGTAAQIFESFNKIKAKCNENTIVFCAHEYTLSNARFAMSIEPNNAELQRKFKNLQVQRANNEWTVPCKFGDELETNPFLRTHSEEIRSNLGFDEHASDVDVFAAIRKAKDNF